jgi:transcriptional regulator with XRE-family HTH domain
MDINAAKVRKALADLRISQAELSRRLSSHYTGWSEATVSRYMYGTQGEVTLTKLNELATGLHVSPAALVDLEDVAKDDAERKLLRNFRAAQERDRQLAQAQVEPRPSSE